MELHIYEEVFNQKYAEYLYCNTPLQIFYGGGSSGKSVFVCQRMVIDVASGLRNYLVTRNVANTIRNSIFNEVQQAIAAFRLYSKFNINRSDMVITCKTNGNQILFAGLDDAEKLKSIRPAKGVITDIVCEEATEISENTFNQLVIRLRGASSVPKRVTLMFNPIMRLHWISKRFFNSQNVKYSHDKNVLIMHSTYKDNRFLTEDDIRRIESFKETDPFYWTVYGLGEWGVLGSLIFTNWEVADLSGMVFDKVRHGLDFGYSEDPMAYVCSARANGTLYILNEHFERGLTNPDIARVVTPYVGGDILWCDSAEPKSIAELRQCGVRNARPVQKKRLFSSLANRNSSVLFRIQWLRQFHIVIDERCQNMINEVSVFRWQQDKQGNAISVPVDKDNHGIDALGYSWESDMINSRPMLITSRTVEEHRKRERMEADNVLFDQEEIEICSMV